MGFTKDIIGTNESVGGINLFEKVQSTQPATPYTAGLMSATDKSKLDSLENYVHPDSGVVPGKYMQVDVNEQGHVVAGRELQNSTLEDYRIKDAYIDLSDNSIVLGSHRLKPITPSDKVRWEQIVDTPNTLKEFGVTDVALSDGTINIGGDLITPLTADSQIAADKIAGVIDLKNIPVGAMERCVVVEDDTARFALTTNDVQKGDTVKVINPTPTMYMVVDENKLDSADGYVVYSAGNANSVPWSGITDKPDHYYELPPADINTLGGVIVGDNITVDTEGKISTHPPYVLPQATNSTLGGVKIGENLSMQSDGTLSVPNATSTTAGVVKAGTNINIDDDGTISTEKYQLPTATNMRLGGVRIGKYLSVDSEGLLNATGVPITASKTDMGGVIIGENIDIDENGKISVTLPTKTSELENDSEFITTENLSLHNNDENAHASKFEAMHGQLVNVYNNVAEMKQSTRLKAGMAAKTLGYYSTNDGGGAYYIIRAKQDSDVGDSGSIHELTNGLVAELIVENGTVNVKQFGAKGDGVTDDTEAIQNTVTCAENTANYIVFIPSAVYLISSTLNIPNFIKLRAGGKSVFNYTGDNVLINIVEGTKIPPETVRDNNTSPFISGGLVLQRDKVGYLTNNTVAIKFYEREQTNVVKYVISAIKLEELSIFYFNVGIAVYNQDAYLMCFDKILIERVETCFNFIGKNENSGENISFKNCVFATCKKAFYFDQLTGEYNFINCSWDFCDTAFLPSSNKSVIRARFTQCHWERGDLEYNFPLIIGSEISMYSQLVFNQCDMGDKNNNNAIFADGKYIVSGEICHNHDEPCDLKYIFIVPKNVKSTLNLLEYGTGRFTSESQMLNSDCLLRGLVDGRVTTSLSNYVRLGNSNYYLKCSNTNDYTVSEKDIDDFGKQVTITKEANVQSTFYVKCSSIPCIPGKSVKFSWSVKNLDTTNAAATLVNITFYDALGNVIEGNYKSYLTNHTYGNSLSFSVKSTHVQVPSCAVKMDVEYYSGIDIMATEIVFGGMFIQYYA